MTPFDSARNDWAIRPLGCVVGLLLMVLLAGCAREALDGEAAERDLPEPAPSAPGVIVQVYDCADGERIVTQGREGERLRLHRAGESWVMHAASSQADGTPTTYRADNGVVWQDDGPDGRLTLGDDRRVRCGESPDAIVWEEARLRGVDYRAEAGDRSWELEIAEGELQFRHRERDDVLRADPATWSDDQSRLQVGSSDTGMNLERLDLPCERGGANLEQVRITVEGRPMQGCGTFLEPMSKRPEQ